MDRRYRLELQMVRVPVVWRAKVPEKKLFPVTRKVPEARRMERRARAAAHMFMARMLEGVPDWLRPEGFMPPGPLEVKGNKIVFIRYRPLPPWEGD